MTRRFFIGSATSFGAFSASRLFAAPSGLLSGERPNLRLGVLSDVHIRVTTGDRGCMGGPEAFRHALEYFRDRGVDAVLIAGDMSDLGLGDELMLVAKTWFDVFPNDRAPDGRKVERLFITGNHEGGAFVWNGNLARLRKMFKGDDVQLRRQLLRADFAGWWERAFREPYQRFCHKEVNGYHFLNAHWDNGVAMPDLPLDDLIYVPGRPFDKVAVVTGETFGKELKNWLDAHGRELDLKRPFFYQQHRALWKSNYADWAWNHDKGISTEALSHFPNAVSFAGDTHYSLTDERSIWQGSFTSVGTSSLRYSGLPYDFRLGLGYENTTASGKDRARLDAMKTTPQYDTKNAKQGQILSVYDERMVFERRDFVMDCPLGDDWVIPFGGSRPYSFAERAAKTRAPQFAAGAKLAVEKCQAKPRGAAQQKQALSIVIPAALPTDGNRCIEYRVTVSGSKGEPAVFHVLAEGFNHPLSNPRTSSATKLSLSLDRLPAGPWRISACPLDCWGHLGPELVVEKVV